MPASLQTYKVTKGVGNASAPFNSLVQAVEDALNALGDTTKTGFGSGQVFDPAQIKQSAAATGDWLAWSTGSAAFVKATPAATTAVVINDTTLPAPAASFDFTSIPATYKHLMISGSLRSDRTDTDDDIGVRFNNDSGTNYDSYAFMYRGTGPTGSAQTNFSVSSAQLTNLLQGDNNDVGQFSTADIWIPNYANAANNKAIHAIAGRKRGTTTGSLLMLFAMGAWQSNVAINRVTLIPARGTNFVAGSRAVLYGY